MPNMAYEYIKDEIKSQGKTLTQMADLIGKSSAVPSNLFNGDRELQIEEVPKLAKWLNKSSTWILYGTENPSQDQLIARLSVVEQAVLQLTTDVGKLTRKIENFTNANA